jgi:hypothetical protein
MQFRQLHSQGQSEARAPEPAGKAVIDLPEQFQRLADLIAGHSDPGVLDPKAQAFSIRLGLRADLDPAPWRGKLDRVRQEIDQDLLELGLISIN